VDEAAKYRWRRVITLALIGIMAEGALFILSRVAPAMAGLIRPLYAAVAAVLLFNLWHSARRRGPGLDRRRGDRRGESSP
jgi:hypothetical protein